MANICFFLEMTPPSGLSSPDHFRQCYDYYFFSPSGVRTAQKATTVADGDFLLFPFPLLATLRSTVNSLYEPKLFDFTC